MVVDGIGGVEIEYNVLNKLERIVGDGGSISYFYSASGEKLGMQGDDGSLTFYRSVFTYDQISDADEELLYVSQPEGLVVKEGDEWVYKYFKTDHVGSVRTLLAARGGNKLINEQSSDFYPSGFARGGLNNLHLNKYLYGGKEIQDGLDLGYYDFHARQYNSFLVRWSTQDPKLQTTNPYLYCGNSPLMYVDPDGEFFWVIGAAIAAGMGYSMGKAAGLTGMDLFAYTFANALIGVVSGGIGAGIGGGVASSLGYGGFAGGLVSGAVGGAVGGLVSGLNTTALNNAMFGTNNNLLLGGLKGGLMGAAAGGITGGVSRGLSAHSKGGNFWNGKMYSEFEVPYAPPSNNPRDATNEMLRARVKNEFGVQGGEYGVSEYTIDPNLKRYGVKANGYFGRSDKPNANIGGYAEYDGNKYSKVAISPAVTMSSDAIMFRSVVGHEMIHASHYTAFGSYFNLNYSESVAYRYSAKQYFDAGRMIEGNKILNLRGNPGNVLLPRDYWNLPNFLLK